MRPHAREPQLMCPSCERAYASDERFCAKCRVPLTLATGHELEPSRSELHRRARKVKPQLTEGKLVRVAGARNQAEAEFIQDMLLEEGVPSILRRSAGFDVPDFLAAGPRDVLVPASGAVTAREVLLEAELISPDAATARVAPVRLAAALMGALGIGALIVWGLTQLIG